MSPESLPAARQPSTAPTTGEAMIEYRKMSLPDTPVPANCTEMYCIAIDEIRMIEAKM